MDIGFQRKQSPADQRLQKAPPIITIITVQQYTVITVWRQTTYSASEIYYSPIYRRYTELRRNVLNEETTNPTKRNRNSFLD